MFNIVAVSDFNMGAMENKGLNIFNDALVLASPETATDNSFLGIERVIAHEYFHNWTGNRITCRDWFQLCLKEGLTVFRDQEFGADERSATEQRINEVRQLKARQFPEDAGPLAHPVRPDRYIEINNFYTATVYQKGAEVVRMIQTLLGREGFRKGMDLYFERHDGQAATVEDFVACFEDASGKDFKQFMTWYSQAGTPELVCQLKYNAKAKTADLIINQVLPPTPGEPKKKPLHIPMRLGLLGGNGQDLELTLASGERLADGLVELRKRTENFRFRDVPSPPVASLAARIFRAGEPHHRSDRRGAAVPDGQRQRSVQSLASGPGLRHARAAAARSKRCRAGERPRSQSRSSTRCRRRIGQRRRWSRAIGRSSCICRARTTWRGLSAATSTRWPSTRRATRCARRSARGCTTLRRDLPAHGGEGSLFAGPGAGRPPSAAQRGAGLPDKPRPARRHCPYRGAFRTQPEPDRRNVGSCHAVGAQHAGTSARPSIGSTERWKDDHLVIDNWFAYQAASPLASSLATVKKLTRHPLFSIKNPNKVRALIGTFAMANPVNFNRPDGRGYDFVADRVLEIDAFNPQIAARLLSAFRSWKALEPERRRVAKKTLQRVAKAKPLSHDVFEIVSKMLE